MLLKQKMLAIAITLLLMANVFVLDVWALNNGNSQSKNAKISISGNILRVEMRDIEFGTIFLSGYSQEVAAFISTPWAAVDPTGTGSGWHIAMTMTTLDDHNGHTLPNSRLHIRLHNSDITTISGNTKPVSLADPNWVQIETPPRATKIMTAATNTGMGRYLFTPEFKLTVPSNAHAARYISNILISITASP